MNYHNITQSDMLNGDGLRVVLWTAGCNHHCKNCQNPITWNPNDGLLFDKEAEDELFTALDKEYHAGITFSGGDPLNENNLSDILRLCKKIKSQYTNKTIWLYSGYTYEEIFDVLKCDLNQETTLRQQIISLCDVFVDSKFEEKLADIKYHWAGSTNQRVIDVQATLTKGNIMLWQS